MNLFDLFKKKAAPPDEPQKGESAPQKRDMEDLEFCQGMRVEVTAFDGRLLFVAKLLGIHGAEAELLQYSESAISQVEEPLPARIRGYIDRDRLAIYMEGQIMPMSEKRWAVTELKLRRIGNDRAFFRLTTDLPAIADKFTGLGRGEKPCRLLNISVGGACISSEYKYHEGDTFLLKVRLLEDRPESVMFSQVVRVIEKEGGPIEYGCRFLELTEADQQKITQNIFTVQRQQRGNSP